MPWSPHGDTPLLNTHAFFPSSQERLLITNIETLEKEATSRQQSQEAYKRKSVECQQREEDLRVTVQKYLGQLNEAQTTVQEKASAYEQVSFRHQRLQVSHTHVAGFLRTPCETLA